MQKWYTQARENSEYILQAIKKQPFITELLNGTLPIDVFEFYINQDSIYLEHYKKVLAAVGLKCTHSDDMQFFLKSATGIIEVEDHLHQVFLKDVQLSKEPSPSCELYVSYLTKMTTNYSLEEGLAATLPCFTIYKEIGDYILANQNKTALNPFQNWIDMYGGEGFAKSVEQAINIVNKYASKTTAETVEKMNLAFEKSSKLEFMFWDSAYKKEQWKI
jgi:thiaminase/transcriptional activator TenA